MLPATAEILIVNCDVVLRGAIRESLSGSGHGVVEADSGLTALKILQSVAVKLVVMDISIGDLDGWRLARIIRSGIYRCERDIPIILVTNSWCERITQITAREFGMNHLLSSDSLERLPQLVETCLAGSISSLLSPRLLVVEDHSDNAELVKRILRNKFIVEVASDGASGLAAWLKGRHDLVLLDVMLPGMSGPEILERILRIEPQQPVVIMTAHSSMEMAEELMTKGAVDFISKPFRAEQLRQVCELASRREDYMVSNAQFAARLEILQERTEAYRKVSEDHQRLLDNLSTVIFELDEKGSIRFLSRAWTRLTGFPIEESLGKKLTSYLATEGRLQKSRYSRQLKGLVSGKLQQCEFELPLLTRERKIIWLECKLDVIGADQDSLTIFGCLDDISKRKKAQQELEFLAMHDHLTGVNNRHYFDNVINQMTASAARGRDRHALLYIDLDHFKVINDTFGHNRGDIVLRDIATLLRSRVRKSDVLCRIGGDEFAVLIYNCGHEQAQTTADAICELIQGYQYSHAGQQLAISCSVGVCEIDGKMESSAEYVKQADTALYVAKRRGRNLVHFYDPADRESADLRASIDWARRFRKAIEDDNLFLLFQPVMHIKSGAIAYYEALIRLNLPEEEVVMPGDFIPALEDAGEMALLDHWVVSHAIDLLGQFSQLHQIAINLSAQAFRDERLVSLIKELLAENQVDPRRIIFELTESASMTNIAATQRMIEQLRQIGCSFALDDFGTGFSTFSYLKQFPAESIKVDGSFIAQLDKNREDQAVVRAIIEVAQALGKQTVAEYVENEAVLALIRELGIDFAQGYFIGHPIPVEEILQASSISCCARF
ncbi:MAG: EAL domain-containing protein [Desulfuromonadales bacterium]|nr:EAL domain-containing protein [Desulfuromonadales bacterium]